MPTIKTLSNCRITMYFDDHPPPHFHVILTDGRDALVEIEGQAITGDIAAREIREALDWADANRATLTTKWAEFN